MELLKSLSGKVLIALLTLGVAAAGISWWQMDPDARNQLLAGVGRGGVWVLIVVAIPWLSFFLIGRIGRIDSNLAGAILILALTAIEFALLLWLFRGAISGSLAWTFTAAATLLAGVYNLFTCDWIAEKAG